MVRLRIIMRGSEQCVRLIWSVIVLRWSYTDFRFRAAMPRIKSSQIHSSRAVAGAGSCTEGTPGSIILRVLTPMRVQSHAWSFIPGWSFCSSFILAQNPRHLPQQPRARSSSCSDGVSGSCDAVPETASRGLYQKYPFDRSNSGRSRRLRHGDEGRRAPSADVLRRVE
jgi:hypothetical protein